MLQKPENYPNRDFIRLGWANPNESRVEVDFVGHSWFFKKEWLDDLFAGTESLQDFKIAGEDMGFSLALQRKGIKTFVPPQPYKKPHLWGNNPQQGALFVDDEVALFNTAGVKSKYNDAMNETIKLGFKILKDRDLVAYKNTLSVYNKSYIKKRGFLKYLEKVIRHRVKRALGVNKYQ